MKPVRNLIKEALDDENYYNPSASFLRNYYDMLLRKANEHKNIVQTNRDDGFIEIHKNISKNK